MKTDLLLKLADMLEADAANPSGLKFDMHNWGMTQAWGDQPELSCGTTGCAFGLAAISDQFEGLTFSMSGNYMHPQFRRADGVMLEDYEAAKELFDITVEQSHQLFCPDYYPSDKLEGADSEKFVAARIRQLVADGQFNVQSRYEIGDEDEEEHFEPEDQDQGDVLGEHDEGPEF